MRTCLAMVLWLAAGTASAEEIRIVGSGKEQHLDADLLPAEQRPRYDIFKVRCTKCHAMARPIAALTTGITPVTGSQFDQKEIKKYVVKMMRKPNSGISREDAREILLFLQYALGVFRPDEAAKSELQP